MNNFDQLTKDCPWITKTRITKPNKADFIRKFANYQIEYVPHFIESERHIERERFDDEINQLNINQVVVFCGKNAEDWQASHDLQCESYYFPDQTNPYFYKWAITGKSVLCVETSAMDIEDKIDLLDALMSENPLGICYLNHNAQLEYTGELYSWQKNPSWIVVA